MGNEQETEIVSPFSSKESEQLPDEELKVMGKILISSVSGYTYFSDSERRFSTKELPGQYLDRILGIPARESSKEIPRTREGLEEAVTAAALHSASQIADTEYEAENLEIRIRDIQKSQPRNRSSIIRGYESDNANLLIDVFRKLKTLTGEMQESTLRRILGNLGIDHKEWSDTKVKEYIGILFDSANNRLKLDIEEIVRSAAA